MIRGPFGLQMLFLTFCNRYANKSYDIFKTILATDKLFVEGWVIHRIYDMPTEYLILKN